MEPASLSPGTRIPDRNLRRDDVERIVAGVEGWLEPYEGRLLYRLESRSGRAHRRDPQLAREVDDLAGRGREGGRGRGSSQSTRTRVPISSVQRERRRSTSSVRTSQKAASPTMPKSSSRHPPKPPAHGRDRFRSSRSTGTTGTRGCDRTSSSGSPTFQTSAVVAFHDTFVWPGPERVVREALIETNRFTSFFHAETTTAARLCERLGLRGAPARRAGFVRG
jgi:hypothetical protein